MLLIDSYEEDNFFDFDDSDSECSVRILCDENSSVSEDKNEIVPSVDDISNFVTQPPQICWQDNPNLQQFPFIKQKQLLVLIPEEGNLYDFFFRRFCLCHYVLFRFLYDNTRYENNNTKLTVTG